MLYQNYKDEIVPKLQKELNKKNSLALPRVTKVVVNMRIPEAKEDKQIVQDALADLKLVTGQLPKVCRARKAIAGFKLRQGDPIGLKVTLRGKRMYDFLDRLFNVILPRLRDFRGLSDKQFDQNGNFNIGLKDFTVFPEVDIDKVKTTRGMQITIVTNTDNSEKAKILLSIMGLVFSKEG